MKRVVFKEYNLTEDQFTFFVEYDDAQEDVAFIGDELDVLKMAYDLNGESFMSPLGLAIIKILHDQKEIDSDDPAQFVGRSWEF